MDRIGVVTRHEEEDQIYPDNRNWYVYNYYFYLFYSML